MTTLATATGASMSLASRHLTLLRKDNIVKARRERQTIMYALADAKVGKIVSTLTETFCRPDSQAASPDIFTPTRRRNR